MHRLYTATFVLFLGLLPAAPVLAVPPLDGLPDAGFDGDGKREVEITVGGSSASAMVSDLRAGAYGVLSAVVYSYTDGEPDFANHIEVRFLLDSPTLGSVSLGTFGAAQFGSFANSSQRLWPITNAAGGLTGFYFGFTALGAAGDGDFGVCRLSLVHGTAVLDAGYGAGGCRRVAVDLGTTTAQREDYMADMTVDAQGRVLQAGSAARDDGTHAAVVMRYDATGTLDTTFNHTGILSFQFGRKDSSAVGVAVDAAGRVIVAGDQHLSGLSYDMAVARLTDTGDFDATFNGTGVKLLPLDHVPQGLDIAYALALDAGGNIYLGGSIQDTATTTSPCIVKLDASGQPAANFGTNGVFVDGTNDAFVPTAMVLAPGGSLYLAGVSANQTSLGAMHVSAQGTRLCPYGTLATCRAEVSYDATYVSAPVAALDPQGRLWIGSQRTKNSIDAYTHTRLIGDRLFSAGNE